MFANENNTEWLLQLRIHFVSLRLSYADFPSRFPILKVSGSIKTDQLVMSNSINHNLIVTTTSNSI